MQRTEPETVAGRRIGPQVQQPCDDVGLIGPDGGQERRFAPRVSSVQQIGMTADQRVDAIDALVVKGLEELVNQGLCWCSSWGPFLPITFRCDGVADRLDRGAREAASRRGAPACRPYSATVVSVMPPIARNSRSGFVDSLPSLLTSSWSEEHRSPSTCCRTGHDPYRFTAPFSSSIIGVILASSARSSALFPFASLIDGSAPCASRPLTV